MQHDFILLDRSGSMQNLWVEALGSINGYVKKLADEKVDTGVTLATFDENAGSLAFEVVRDRIIPGTWHTVTEKDATPRGMTPLNDAVLRLVSLAKAGNYDKVAITIITDGAENASKEDRTGEKSRKLLDECRAKNWQVTFLGANFDNAQQAASYGNSARQTIQTSASNFAGTMSSMAGKRAAYGATGATMSWSDEEKEVAKKQ